MTDLTDLTALADRLRGLSEPDDQLGAELAMLGQGQVVHIEGPHTGDSDEDEYTVLLDAPDGQRKRVYVSVNDMPDRSVDAALALCERLFPGHKRTMTERAADCRVVVWTPSGTCAGAADGPTLCAAILLAVIDALVAHLQHGSTE